MNRSCPVALVICLSLPLAALATPSMPADPSKLKWVLPVRSERLTPGTVPPRTLDLPAITPLFLVGHDLASLEWLSRHAQVLRDLGASGLAVEVTDVQALRRIQAAAPGVNIWPVSGDDIAERLELQHYPVLITTTGLEQ
ncbi:integrating conjugative element protein [Pseudomonas sp. GD03817]|jgi:integrating conjugative element protein (TIGR03765 family)|uniref:Integrating conjugative element protein n=2 Tax=Pseudomonas putida group TaxID=136845 RepID=A0A1L5PTC1_PSEPU|nr:MULTISPECIES: integrating conjugative element protein [Pseudomonas]MBA6136367.1 integrating conjugative element protein [Pseudomonas monteilii]APO83325.1 integrating conjugative element protein [Pseudomonas putida]MCE0989648.1 integrating conjugative element protein [Pseudomonas alloputida]MDH1400729.1 integrating conjugative element protein [Pseudomonas sp. GD03730]MDH1774507.1 integrating conjugative element protein [Pseudomonas sp. GD03817]